MPFFLSLIFIVTVFPVLMLRFFHHRPKRSQGQLRDLEELLSEGDPDDRDAEKASEKEVAQCQFPSGEYKPQKDSFESLKHCSPIGIPTIVMHQKIPARIQPRPLSSPPQISQIIFPSKVISVSLPQVVPPVLF